MVEKPIYIRKLRVEDWAEFVSWLAKHLPVNEAEPEIILRNSTIFVAFNDEGIIAYLPVHSAFVLGALAPNPTADKSTLARGLDALNRHLVGLALEQGVGEIFVQPSTEQFAEVLRDHSGYQDVRPTLSLRMVNVDKKKSEAPQIPAEVSKS